MESFGSRLRMLRKNAGMTQIQLATAAGVSQSNINTWETDKSSPLPNGLIALATALNCSVDYLLGREEEDGRIITYSTPSSLSDVEQHIVDTFRLLTNRRKIMVVGYIDGVYAGQQEGA